MSIFMPFFLAIWFMTSNLFMVSYVYDLRSTFFFFFFHAMCTMLNDFLVYVYEFLRMFQFTDQAET